MKGVVKRTLNLERSRINHAYGLTDTGRRRENNEDFFLVEPERRIFVVADGMGGHNAGEVASTEATRAVSEFFTPEIVEQMNNDPSSIGDFMADAFHHANQWVNEVSCQNPDCRGMGCALIVAFMSDDTLHTCHVGDVRCYIVNPSSITQITHDHTVVAGMVQDGRMTTEEARTSRLRSYLTRVIGQVGLLESEYHVSPLREKDRVLLCSDGLWDMLPEERIHEIVSSTARIDSACKSLISEANDAGGRDNITAVIFQKYEATLCQ